MGLAAGQCRPAAAPVASPSARRRRSGAVRAAFLAVTLTIGSVPGAGRADVVVEAPRVAFAGAPVTIEIADDALEETDGRVVEVITADGPVEISLLGPGNSSLSITLRGGADRELIVDGRPTRLDTLVLPGWLTLVPPALAIITALVTRQVVVSLIAGIFVGALFLARFNPLTAFNDSLGRYIVGSLAGDTSHVTIVFITAMLGGMSGVIQRSGGARAVVEALAHRARGARGAQLATWAMGLVIFFDDYANTLIVGNTMRPLTDRLRISREKLSFLVDSTAAPVASIAPISTWIGFEVGLIHDAIGGLDVGQDAYGLFLASIPYRFYPIFALVLGFWVIWLRRDFGAMLAAERRARSGGGVVRPGGQPLMDTGGVDDDGFTDAPGRMHASSALVPIVIVIVATLGGILLTGWNGVAEGERSLRALIGAGDSYQALLWAGALGSIAAVMLAVVRRSLSLGDALAGWVNGIRSMTLAFVILALAWGIGAICKDVGTADVLVGYLGERFPAVLLPAAVFVVSALVSFATGTSWGTMAILIPIVVPLGAALSSGGHVILVGALSGVLAGSVFGDHCSPISDTTVLSSLASGADHVDHVRTQLPYALVAAVIAIGVGDIPTAFGLPPWVSLIVGVALVFGAVRWWGRSPEGAGPAG